MIKPSRDGFVSQTLYDAAMDRFNESMGAREFVAPPPEVIDGPIMTWQERARQGGAFATFDLMQREIRELRAALKAASEPKEWTVAEEAKLHAILNEYPPERPVAAAMICPQCDVDRLKNPCPNSQDDCAMVADAHLLATSQVAK